MSRQLSAACAPPEEAVGLRETTPARYSASPALNSASARFVGSPPRALEQRERLGIPAIDAAETRRIAVVLVSTPALRQRPRPRRRRRPSKSSLASKSFDALRSPSLSLSSLERGVHDGV